jgi:hypothetical protein
MTNQRIICSALQFDNVTGAEIDKELCWGPPPLMTGNYIDLFAEGQIQVHSRTIALAYQRDLYSHGAIT